MDFADLDNLKSTHKHEEDLRQQSLALIEANPAWKRRVIVIEKSLNVVFAFTHDHPNETDDELTLQFLGIRLFNTGVSALKLGLSGYYQPAYALIRDALEVGFLIHYFSCWPEKISEWKNATDQELRSKFKPFDIRTALDNREGNTDKKRMKAYERLCQYGAHATYKGFTMTTRNNFGELGPFVDQKYLRALIEEMTLRLCPASLIYGSLFPNAAANMRKFRDHVADELIKAMKVEESERP